MSKVRVYPFPVEPEKYAWYDRRPFPVITRKALDHKIQFSCLRGFMPESNSSNESIDGGSRFQLKAGTRLINLEQTINMYVHHFKLGKVIWPAYPTLFAGNFKDIVDICVRDGLYLYDFWGYVPGSKTSARSMWGEYVIPEEVDTYMQEKLGDHFLGYDNGEQDGRYVHWRARQQAAVSDSREAQYEVFQAYFEKLNDCMRNHTVTLASLTFLPYFAREGNTIMLGAETAQALPGNNMWFSFIRGAAKQYGLLYYGNASVWNRWGYKDYEYMDREPVIKWGSTEAGRFAGTSLSLLKKLMYNHWMYGCDILGFENRWLITRPREEGDVNTDRQYITGDTVNVFTPIGNIQQKCVEFVEKYGYAGVQHTPVAIMLDFHAGWMPARQLYSPEVYVVWGMLPYNMSDHQTHCLMSQLYPHYEDAGFYRDERGFETATPYGEIMDILMSDATEEVLKRYSVIVLTRGVKLDRELTGKLRAFAEAGGTVIGFAGTVKEWGAEELFGVKALAAGENGEYEAILSRDAAYAAASNSENGTSASCGAECAAGGAEQRSRLVVRKFGRGEFRLILHEHGLEATGEELTAKNAANEPICQPYRLTKETEDILADAYNGVQLLKVSNPSLQYVTSVRGKGEYTFMVASSQAQTEAFDIESAVGEIESVVELPTLDGTEELEEFLPLLKAEPGEAVQKDGEYTINPGCVRLFRIKVKDAQTEELEESNPGKREGVRYVSLPKYEARLKKTVLDHPTLQHYFDGVVVPARYLEDLDMYAVKKEAHYLNLQQVRLVVDFGDLINHYPDLSLIGNIEGREEEALERVGKILDKAKEYLCDGIILCPQRNAENEYSVEEASAGFERISGEIRAMAEAKGIRVLMKNRRYAVMKPEITAFDTATAMTEGEEAIPATAEMVLLSRPGRDLVGQMFQMNLPVSGGKEEVLVRWAKEAKEKGLPIALTAEYGSWDEVISDIEWLDKL